MDMISDLFSLQSGPAEMFLRGTTIYWTLLILLRIAGRRDLGSMGAADILVLVLVADAAGTAMSGESDSLGDGMIVVTTIVGWSFVLDRVAYYVPFVRKLMEPSRVCLIRDGRIDTAGLRREHLTRQELMEQLRLKGVATLDEVRRAYMESTGEFSVIRYPDASGDGESTLGES